MLSAFITHADCARHDMGAHHPECPERLGAINDHLLVKGLLDYMIPYDAPLATEEQLGRAHASLYVKEIFDASPTEGLHAVDPDTNMCPHTLKAALRAAGAAVQATNLVLAGEAPTAFCSIRPATTQNVRPRWASAFSTTSPSASATRWTCTTSNASR